MFSLKRTLLFTTISFVIFSGLYSFLITKQPKVAEKPAVLQASTPLFQSFTQAQKDCISRDLGDSLFQALNQGTATPTTYEQGVIYNCYNSGGASSTSSSATATPTTAPTSTACPSGQYWDSTTATCKTNTTSSTMTCPSGWSYNATAYHGSPGCVQYNGSTLVCGSGYTYNGTYCLPNSSSGTSSGSGSGTSSTTCGTGYVWNGSYCAAPVNSNCSSGYSWNGSYCASNTTNSSTSCSSGYYWNGSSCQPNSATSPYYNGSGSNYTPYSGLDSKVVDCWKAKIGQTRLDAIRAAAPPTPTESDALYLCYSQTAPTSTLQTTTYNTGFVTYTSGGVRLADKSPQKSCVQKTLGTDFDWFNNLANPSATSEYQRFETLMKKAQLCFNTATTTQTNSLQEPKVFLSPEIIACLKNVVGETRFSEIMANSTSISPQERDKGAACFSLVQGEKKTEVEYKTAPKLDPNVESCLRLAIGETRFKEISLGSSKPNSAEIAKGNSCFGVLGTPIAPPTNYKLDSKISSCVTNSLSPNQLNQITKGEIKPTEDQRSKVIDCFKDINKIQQNFLPLPPTQIPFLKADGQKAVVGKTETTFQKNTGGKDTPVITFKGNGLPNETVDLYLFSDPVVVTLKTDANGVWTYNLDTSLKPGNHVAYVAVKTGQEEAVRSEVFSFAVAQAAETTNQQSGLIIASPRSQVQTKSYLTWVIGLVGVGIVSFILLLIFLARKNTATNKSTLPPQNPL